MLLGLYVDILCYNTTSGHRAKLLSGAFISRSTSYIYENNQMELWGLLPGGWDMIPQLKWLKMASKYLSTVMDAMHERVRRTSLDVIWLAAQVK